jgi:hypothetical protein
MALNGAHAERYILKVTPNTSDIMRFKDKLKIEILVHFI